MLCYVMAVAKGITDIDIDIDVVFIVIIAKVISGVVFDFPT